MIFQLVQFHQSNNFKYLLNLAHWVLPLKVFLQSIVLEKNFQIPMLRLHFCRFVLGQEFLFQIHVFRHLLFAFLLKDKINFSEQDLSKTFILDPKHFSPSLYLLPFLIHTLLLISKQIPLIMCGSESIK